MKQKSQRPARGLSLYMSILSAVAIEAFTYFEFEPTTLFFGAWTAVFAALSLWELTHEVKRSRETEEKVSSRALPAGYKPVLVIDLDKNGQYEEEEAVPVMSSQRRPLLRDRISHLRGLEECLLIVSFGILALVNLSLALGVAFFGLVL
ncbi:hypothetical protein [Acidaminobacter hydrogenoformans]|uniref:Uncharacterized protein n=1 Tax=Acidaminobacter hydrogenoformans DSM 2784 TaxID=1120920 RepID=A0A1G5RYA3_9FIRM|nr:hypothetical protein [Acidaminobacter hydrogenoformans]SCZ79072.1 hypothetical protein SAMN03080599_01580 [Acidaminobacter hydrogenoformans DSM 2784]